MALLNGPKRKHLLVEQERHDSPFPFCPCPEPWTPSHHSGGPMIQHAQMVQVSWDSPGVYLLSPHNSQQCPCPFPLTSWFCVKTSRVLPLSWVCHNRVHSVPSWGFPRAPGPHIGQPGAHSPQNVPRTSWNLPESPGVWLQHRRPTSLQTPCPLACGADGRHGTFWNPVGSPGELCVCYFREGKEKGKKDIK